MSDILQTALAIAGLLLVVGFPVWQATRRKKLPKPTNCGESHNPSGEVTQAVQGGYNVLDSHSPGDGHN